MQTTIFQKLAIGVIALASVRPASATNLIINGGFEAGNTGFSASGYSLQNSGGLSFLGY
jgi:hypothetical protein